jgi:hypothetical protein
VAEAHRPQANDEDASRASHQMNDT